VLKLTASAAPLSAAEFRSRIEQLALFESEPQVAVAVSGGPDSLALAILAQAWVLSRGGQICALSVDHGLRPESGGEIEQVRTWLAARSIRHETLVWRGDKPSTGIQEAARTARYGLLEAWCRERGWLHLLTGHHRDDQIETFLLRQDAGSGRDGLAAMPAVRELAGCRILRPLLDVPKARLIATLAAERQPFITDPSNGNLNFARSLLRQTMQGDKADAMFADIRALGRERRQRQQRGHALLACAMALHPAGFARIDPGVLLAAPSGEAERALTLLVSALGGRPYPPRRRSVVRLLETLAGAAPGGHVLGGFRFIRWRGNILALRELAAAPPAARLAPGAALLWDRRFEVSLPAATCPLDLHYLGRDGAAELHQSSPRLADARLPPLIHPVLLGFWDKSGLAAVPSLGYRRDERVALPQVALRPVNCLSHASFAVV
jgi:tRNA(Ile)-lysidine synthase